MHPFYDVIVVGGGHAGCEAAAAATRIGAKTALVTLHKHKIGTMSCNPAIGGLGKGHIVREVDAMGGLMGQVADAAGIQFRLLNRSKGPAVRGPRAQMDRDLYAAAMKKTLFGLALLDIIEGEVDDLIVTDDRLEGLKLLDERIFNCSAAVLTTGTFLGGVIHVGNQQHAGGRIGEKAVLGLCKRFRKLDLRIGRLKTGTPPRLKASTINFAQLEEQKGDDPPEPFSAMTDHITTPQISCFVTLTNCTTHTIIEKNIHKSAIYSGNISGVGPRYCPSIEDKIVRFKDRKSHLIFLEPEGLKSDLIYPNGISTSLPEHVQLAFVRSMKGLENVEIAQYGYAIEYDHIDPRELSPSLELKALDGLFLAGQINGTTGYEEAAGQGLIAGINAARRAENQPAVLLSRSDAYIGVMIDDLVTRGVSEPYRMFTSRAEYRLSLRSDNADLRLTEKAKQLGLIDEKRWLRYTKHKSALQEASQIFKSLIVTPTKARKLGIKLNQDGKKRSAFDLLSFPNISLTDVIKIWPHLGNFGDATLAQIENDARYAVYMARQKADIEAQQKDEMRIIPNWVDYAQISGLSGEIRQKLIFHQPTNIVQAQKIEGITPVAISLILAHIKRGFEAAGVGKQRVGTGL